MNTNLNLLIGDIISSSNPCLCIGSGKIIISESLYLQRGQTIRVVTSCVVKQEELGQQREKRKENTHCVAVQSYCAETSIGGASAGNAEKVEKAGRKADCEQNIENRQTYETKEEKRKFILEGFQLDTNAILNKDAKLKEAVFFLIHLFF